MPAPSPPALPNPPIADRQQKKAPLACAPRSPLALFFSPPPLSPHPSLPSPHTATLGFIRVDNGNFVDEDCREFYVAGYNTWQVRRREEETGKKTRHLGERAD